MSKYEIEKLNITSGDTLIVTVKLNNVHRNKKRAHIQHIADLMRKIIIDKSVKILVVPQEDYTFTVLSQNQQTITNKTSKKFDQSVKGM